MVGKQQIDDVVVERIRMLVDRGWSHRATARRLGVNTKTVVRYAGKSKYDAPRPLGEAAVKFILEKTRDGWSAQRIADKLGCNIGTVDRWRAKSGVRLIPDYRDADWEFAAQLIDDGCPVGEVAKTIGVSYYSVQKRFPGQDGRSANARLWRMAMSELADAGIDLYAD